MKIVSVRTRAVSCPLERPYASADAYFERRTGLLVFVETDAGLRGVGEAVPALGPPISTQTVIERELAPLLVGEDPLRTEHLWQRMYHATQRHGRRGLVMNAIAGVDIALWDLLGQAVGQPIFRLLGACHDRLDAYASAGFYAAGKGPEELAAECRALVDRGYRAVKIKVGRNSDLEIGAVNAHRRSYLRNSALLQVPLEVDVARVEAVREAIGPGIGLAVDANSSWDVPTARRFSAAVAGCRLLWLEEPLVADEVAASAELVRAAGVRIAGFETEAGLPAWRELLARRAIDVAQPAVTFSGGISECRRIATLAHAFDVAYSPHSFSTGVSLAASLHLAAAAPNAFLIEVDCNPNPLHSDLLEDPIEVGSDGTLAPPSGPGLGIRLRADVVDRYAVGA
jgi:L-alanine-DL-glutamate epimerase-like enolase superfamily enzyme